MTNMTDAPQMPTSNDSVVLETNTTVKKSRLPIVAAAVVVAALAAFTIVYFATRDSKDDYTAGPIAQAMVDSLKNSGADITFSGSELKCVDDKGKGLDAATIEAGSFDTIDTTTNPEMAAFAGKVYDQCFGRATRVDLFAAGMAADGTATPEQATCAAEALDDGMIAAGGYEKVFTSDGTDMMTVVFGLFGALGECGIDLGGLGES